MHTWSPARGKRLSIQQLLHLARSQLKSPSGLTLSGGEPTDQAEAVTAFMQAFRGMFPDCEIVLYTALLWQTLLERHSEMVALLDVAVTGPYVRTIPATALAGSANQEVRLLTPLAEELYGNWTSWPLHAMQIGHTGIGTLVTVGIPDVPRMERAASEVGCSSVTWHKPKLASKGIRT